jgi:drug/metabolite transporter (DMT)-like permease
MSRENLGLVLGFVGVCIFAGTLPFTHIAVEHLSPLFVTAGRAALAGLLALATLLVLRRPWPSR